MIMRRTHAQIRAAGRDNGSRISGRNDESDKYLCRCVMRSPTQSMLGSKSSMCAATLFTSRSIPRNALHATSICSGLAPPRPICDGGPPLPYNPPPPNNKSRSDATTFTTGPAGGIASTPSTRKSALETPVF